MKSNQTKSKSNKNNHFSQPKTQINTRAHNRIKTKQTTFIPTVTTHATTKRQKKRKVAQTN